jgi:hypothetical protein
MARINGTLAKSSSYWQDILFCSAASVLVLRFYWIIFKYAVNLFFFDEWDIYTPLFEGLPWWRIFVAQHGPHRQGLGVVVVTKIFALTDWDSRLQAFTIGTAIVLAMILATYLKVRMFGPIVVSDVIIPITFLGLGQWEVILSGPGPSPQAFPLLLLIAYCLSWIGRNVLFRNIFILITNFLLIFTGYGIFIGGITISLFAFETYQSAKQRNRRQKRAAMLSLAIAAASLASFFYGYQFNAASDCYHFPYRNPAAYPVFMGLMYSRFLGIKRGLIFASAVGICVIGIISTLFVRHARMLWKYSLDNRQSVPIVILIGYSLIYSTAAAVGRVCLGLDTARASRYLTLLIPAFLGAYFGVLTIQNDRKRTLFTAFLFLALLPSSIQRNHKEIESFSAFKRSWKECYLAHEDIRFCDAETNFQLYPCPECIHLKEKLEFLKQNRLNLYAHRN